MVDSVVYVIERELLSNRPVELPYIGTLSTTRHSARISNNESTIAAPFFSLQFTGNASIVDSALFATISQQCGVSEADAINLYNNWLEGAVSHQGALLTIDRVCTIGLQNGGVLFSVDERFNSLLNPHISESIIINSAFNFEPKFQPFDLTANYQLDEQCEYIEEQDYPIETKKSHTQQHITSQERLTQAPISRIATWVYILAIVVFATAIGYIAYLYLTK